MYPRKFALLVLLMLGGGCGLAHAGSPSCTNPETKLSWPATDPIWEMCWLPPDESAGPEGSGMELRKVYFKGHLVFVRAHAPMLFAEYKDGGGGDCYRDWKNDTSPILADMLGVWLVTNLMIKALNLIPYGNLDGVEAWRLPRLWYERRKRQQRRAHLRVVPSSPRDDVAPGAMSDSLKSEIDRITREAVRDAKKSTKN